MQLKIQRSQQRKASRFFGSDMGIFFTVTMRAEYTAQEKSDIAKYDLGGHIIFTPILDMPDAELSVKGEFTINGLVNGTSVECQSIGDLQQLEKHITEACTRLQTFLEVAATFDGREILIDFSKPDATTAS